MEHIEFAQTVPVVAEADVLVCGGGPTGIAAALAAARLGCRTALVERYGTLGGMATVGLVGPLSNYNANGVRILGGIPEEFIDDLEELGGAIPHLPGGYVPFEAEMLKILAPRKLKTAGVQLMLHSTVVDAVRDQARLTHVVISNKAGFRGVRARVVIDCTGDADVAFRAGAPYEQSPIDRMQPMTMMFVLGNVDTESLGGLLMKPGGTPTTHPAIRERLAAAVERGELPPFGGPWIQWGSTMRPGYVSINMTRMRGDATDPDTLTEAELRLREDAWQFFSFLRREIPEFSKAVLVNTGFQVGIRETRRIVGEYQLTKEDVLNPKDFPDTICLGSHPIDVHHSEGTGQSLMWLKRPYRIPYRCLLPKGISNLL
ncbi:MAG: FAD-dependent oxidoreductase, partial [Alcaligenaceae bacterium]|nr:FAD-dependent oxidoreductase [Alcaligenaceae bacterium]